MSNATYESPIQFGTGAVWLDLRTPQNFHAGRNHGQAQLIGLHASLYSRQRKTQTSAQLAVPRSKPSPQAAQQKGSFIVRRFRAIRGDDKLAKSRHRKRSSGDGRAQSRMQNELLLCTPNPDTVLRQGYSDPFQSMPVDLTARDWYAIKTAAIFLIPATFPAETHSKFGRQTYFENYHKHLQGFLSDEASLQVLICWGWSVMSRLNSAERSTCLIRSFQYGAKAMEALRPTITCLSQNNEELLKVLRIVRLHCSMAMFIGDREAAMCHQDALRKLVGLVGGLHNLLPFHQCLIVYLIVRIALNTRTRTVLDPAEWNPKRIPVLEEDIDSADILTTKSAISGPWKGVFVALKELALVEKFSDRVADLHWRFLRRHAIKAKVANMWCDLTEPTKATDPVPGISATPTLVYQSSIDMCICLAVQNYIILSSEPATLGQHAVSTTQIFHIMLIRCLDKLELDIDQLESTTPRARDLLWVLGVGAAVEIQVSSQLQRRLPWINFDLEELELSWFMLNFGLLAVRLGYERYDEVARLFERDYVYSPCVQGQILRCSFHSAAGLSSGQSGKLPGL